MYDSILKNLNKIIKNNIFKEENIAYLDWIILIIMNYLNKLKIYVYIFNLGYI